MTAEYFKKLMNSMPKERRTEALLNIVAEFLDFMDTADVIRLKNEIGKTWPCPPAVIAEILDLIDGNLGYREIMR